MEGVVRLVFGCLAKCPQYEPMGRAFSDDLRTRIGATDERGEGSCRVLAKRFGVSWEYVRKVRQQRKDNNSSARRPQSRYGVASRMSKPVKVYMLALVEAQADITIAELREKIEVGQGVSAELVFGAATGEKAGAAVEKKSLHAIERDHGGQPSQARTVPPAVSVQRRRNG